MNFTTDSMRLADANRYSEWQRSGNGNQMAASNLPPSTSWAPASRSASPVNLGARMVHGRCTFASQAQSAITTFVLNVIVVSVNSSIGYAPQVCDCLA